MNELIIVCRHGAAADAPVKGRVITKVVLLDGTAPARGAWQVDERYVADTRWDRHWQQVTDIEETERHAGHLRVDDSNDTADIDVDHGYRVVYECPAPSCHLRWAARVDTWGRTMVALFDAGVERTELSQLARAPSM